MLSFALLAGLALTPAVPTASPLLAAPMPAVTDSTLLLLTRARALAREGQPAEALRTYYGAALRADGPDEWALFRRDLALIATPTELTRWDESAAAARPAMLLAFWQGRDQRDSLPEGGRFAEHVRRVDVALQAYRVAPKGGKMPLVRTSFLGGGDPYDRNLGVGSPIRDYIPTQADLDDRGVIYVRQGEPDARRLGAGTTVESWIYQRAGGPLVVYFTESLFDGSSGNTALVAAPPVAAYASVCEFDGAACTMASRLTTAPQEQRERLRQRTLAAIRELTTPDHARTP